MVYAAQDGSPQTEALEIRVGVRSTSDLPRAQQTLTSGQRRSARLGKDALRDLGVQDLAREEAAEQLVRRYAGQIVDGGLAPVDGAARIVAVVVEMGWDGEGQALWDEGTRDIYLLADMYCNGRASPRREWIQMIEDAIVKAARRLL